jgi:hypothetical protein
MDSFKTCVKKIAQPKSLIFRIMVAIKALAPDSRGKVQDIFVTRRKLQPEIT